MSSQRRTGLSRRDSRSRGNDLASAALRRPVCFCRHRGRDDECAKDRGCEYPSSRKLIVEEPVGDQGEQRYRANEPDIAEERAFAIVTSHTASMTSWMRPDKHKPPSRPARARSARFSGGVQSNCFGRRSGVLAPIGTGSRQSTSSSSEANALGCSQQAPAAYAKREREPLQGTHAYPLLRTWYLWKTAWWRPCLKGLAWITGGRSGTCPRAWPSSPPACGPWASP